MNKLLLEVRRINELMYSNLISESFLKTGVIDDIIRFFDKNKGGLSKISKELGMSINDFIEELSKLQTNDDLVKFINTKSLASEAFTNSILPILKNSISDDVRLLMDEFVQFLDKEVKSNPSIDPKTVYQQIDEFVDTRIKTSYTKLNDEFKVMLKREIAPSLEAAKLTQVPKNLAKVQQIGENWNKVVRACGLNKAERLALNKKFPFRKLRAISRPIGTKIVSNFNKFQEQEIMKAFGNAQLWLDKVKITNNVDDKELNYLLGNINGIMAGLVEEEAANIVTFRTELINIIKKAGPPNGTTPSQWNSLCNKLKTGLEKQTPLSGEDTERWYLELMGGSTPSDVQKLTSKAVRKGLIETGLYKWTDNVFAVLTTSTTKMTGTHIAELILKKGVRGAAKEIRIYLYRIKFLVIPVLKAFGAFVFSWSQIYPDKDYKGIVQRIWGSFVIPYLRALGIEFNSFNDIFKSSYNLVIDLILPITTFIDDIYRGLSAYSEGRMQNTYETFLNWLNGVEEKAQEAIDNTRDEIERTTGVRIPPLNPDDSTSTPTPTDSTTTTRPGGSTPTTTPPPLEPLSPEDIQGWLRIATFTKVNENTYKMKFTTDQNALENFGLPSTFAGKTADVNNVNGTWKYTIDGQENIF